MSLKVFVPDRDNIGHDLDWSVLDRFGQLIIYDRTSDAELAINLARLDPDVVVANRPIFSATALAALVPAGRPRLICLSATGTNTVDLPAARQRGIAVCNVVGYSTDSVAQHTLALALGLLNRVESRDRQARAWTQQPTGSSWTDLSQPIHELAGKTWGIIGLGAIGRRVATIATSLGCNVVWTSPSGSTRPETWPQIDLPTLLASSDIVSIHSPITEQTRGLIGMTQMQLMKPSALLLNLGRGGIIDESALAACLTAGHLGGAALDVLWPEPPTADNPLLRLPAERLILTPHVAWAAVEARQRLLEECGRNIDSWLMGGRRNRVD